MSEARDASRRGTVATPRPSEDRVLSTLNADGSRRWINPKLSKGRFLTRRRAVAYSLIAMFTLIPFIKIGGRPLLLLDVVHREFTFFGVTFFPTETLLMALLMLSIFLSIFLVTALFGRVWCGWACPQTVYMEFVYRPIERFFDGKGRPTLLRRVGKYVAFLLISFYLANTFLAYFVGVDRLTSWVTGSPFEHKSAFLVMAAVTALMMVDFAYAREQMCTLMCPYGRMQSVLLDSRSLIVGYDLKRGEPRGPKRDDRPDRGDCVDCKLCVTTCPTGIDIRDGLQMECVGCTQCIDACDTVMDKIGRARGLIRYASQDELEGAPSKMLRPRLMIYPVLLIAALVAFGVALDRRIMVDLGFLRVRATPYRVLEDGSVANVVKLKLSNRTPDVRTCRLRLIGDGELVIAEPILEVPPSGGLVQDVSVVLPSDRFVKGRARIDVALTDDRGDEVVRSHTVLGPLFNATGDRR